MLQALDQLDTILKRKVYLKFVSGELWLGLEKLHKLTSKANYSLRITLTDFDNQTYVAVYDQFQVL